MATVAYGYDYPCSAYFVQIFSSEDADPLEFYYGVLGTGIKLDRNHFYNFAREIGLDRLADAVAMDVPLT